MPGSTRHSMVPFLLVCLTIACDVAAQGTPRFPSFAPTHAPPLGYTDPVFSLSQAYPTAAPVPEPMPWDTVNFFVLPGALEYARSVLRYAVEGNTEVDWVIQNNAVRKWYHAPWMHPGCGGREFIRGMTRERTSRPQELHPNQKAYRDNWAVGFYNAPGGHTVGAVWQGPTPNPALAAFPHGTVGVKLLFTAATVEDAPFLAGSLEWTGNVYPSTGGNPCGQGTAPARENLTLRLLQIDIAVREARKDHTTGWVFGTFIYDGSAPGTTAFDRMQPVGLMWADDPTVTAQMNDAGVFVNPALKDGFLNPDLIGPWDPGNPAKVRLVHAGLGGRLNGPVDNPVSSCISCHGRAGVPAQSVTPTGANTASQYTDSLFREYFKEVPHGPGPATDASGGTYQRLDYSLQLAVGIRNFHNASPTMLRTASVVNLASSRDEAESAPWEPVAPVAAEGEGVRHPTPIYLVVGLLLLLAVGMIALTAQRV